MFWVKITSGNAFPYLRVVGCAWKIHFPKMHFSCPVMRCKLISVFILLSNTIFRKTKRELSERERGRRARVQRETEEEPRRARLRLTQKPTPTNPENPRPSSFVAPIAPSARSSHPSTDPPKTDRSRRTPKPIVLDPDSSSPIAISPSLRS